MTLTPQQRSTSPPYCAIPRQPSTTVSIWSSSMACSQTPFRYRIVAFGSSRSATTGMFSARTEDIFRCATAFCISLRYVREIFSSTVVITAKRLATISAAARATSPGPTTGMDPFSRMASTAKSLKQYTTKAS